MSEKKPAPKKDIAIAYSSLRMDKGEKLPLAKDKIRTLSAKKPYAWFFDIICSANQIPEASRSIAAIYGYTGNYAPQVPDDKVVLGITTKENERPARTLMNRLSNSYPGELLGNLGLETGRKFLWIAGAPQHKVEEVQDESN